MVSVVGTGGAGKTRVAIEVADAARRRFSRWRLVRRTRTAQRPGSRLDALANALGLQESAKTPLLTTLLSHLSQKQLLLVLDNCEHVIDQARARGGFDPAGVHEGYLPYDQPRGAQRSPASASSAYPRSRFPRRRRSRPRGNEDGAIALFVDRVRSSDARFSVTKENVAPVIDICRRLDGLPLAIELAAARATVLSPCKLPSVSTGSSIS